MQSIQPRKISKLVALLVFVLMTLTTSLRAGTDYFSTAPGVGAPDTLCDVWQALYNGWGLAPNADEDKDGGTNFVESIAGTDPRNPSDTLRVGNTILSGNNVIFTFTSEAGKKYQVVSSDAPNGPTWTLVAGSALVPSTENAAQTIAITKPAGDRKFYKLETLDVDADGDGVSDWAERKTGMDPTVGTSPGNASGGVANDGDTLHSILSLTAAPGSVPAAFEKEGVAATVQVQRSFGTMPLTLTVSGAAGATDGDKASAASADYVFKNMANVTTNTVVIPANQGTPASPYDVVKVSPVADADVEVPEALKVTFNAVGASTGTTGASAVVSVKDADPTNPENRQLYVAYLGREAGTNSTGSGIATALANGDNDSASISLTFSNLSSTQNTAYLRIGNDLEILQLPLGQVAGETWQIRAKQFALTDQAMLDALQQGNLYIIVSSANYPNKEIFGYFNKATGSTTFDSANPSLVAPNYGTTNWQAPTGEALDRDIYRFLGQCTFGATTALHDEVLAEITAAGGNAITGYSNWLDKQYNPTLTPSADFTTLVMAADNEEFATRGNRPVTYNVDPQYFTSAYSVTYDANGKPSISTTANTTQINNNYPNTSANRRREWWTLVSQSKDQVRQRMAMALSEIVVISEVDQTVNDRHYGCAKYWDMLAAGAFGKYRTLLEQVTYSPIMGIYLSHISNRATYDAGGGLMVSPDENYAREIMQLFSVGLILRHPDGSLVLDIDGLPIATYDQTDITELARVMTGFTHGARHTYTAVPQWSGTAYSTSNQRVGTTIEYNGTTYTQQAQDGGHRFFQAPWMYPMKLLGRISTTTYHDFGAKTLFAGKAGSIVVPAQTITSMTDAQTHAAAVTDMTLAHNCLAGDPTSNNSYNGHPNTPVNICRWLIQRLVTSNPSAGYLYRVTSEYTATNGNLGAVLKKILLDYEARSLQLADTSIAAGKVREPILQFVSVLRALKAFSGAPLSILRDNPPPFSPSDTPFAAAYPATEFDKLVNPNPPSLPNGWATGPFRFRIGDTSGNIGQGPQRPPSVFNWFLPDYVVPGPMAQAGLFAPELQISTESTEVAKINWLWTYTWANTVGMSTQPGTDSNVADFILSNGYATPAVRFSAGTFTFNDSNWATPQTVTVTANNNSILGLGLVGSIQYTLGGSTSTFAGVSVAPTAITINENDLINEGLVIAQTNGSTWVQENGITDTFTVMLSAPPMVGATVTVNMTVGAQVTLSVPSLDFNDTNWNTPQIVTLTAVNDATSELAAAANDAVSFTTTSAAANYNGLTTASLTVNVIDNDDGINSYGVLIAESGTPAATAVVETAATSGTDIDSYTIVLTKAPSASVNVTVTPASTQLALSTTAAAPTTFSTQGVAVTRSFTTANWFTPQNITVRGYNDGTHEGTHTAQINHTIGTTAGGYTSGMVIQPVVATISDINTTAGNRILLAHVGGNETRVAEGGSLSDTITVRLRTAPTGNVTVNLGSSQLLCNPSVLTFSPAGVGAGIWSTTQTVTVTAVDDFVYEGLHNSSIIAYSISTDANYYNYGSTNGYLGATLTGTIIDNDRSQVIVTESGGSTVVGEDGTTDTYTLVLSQLPTANVSIALTPSSQVTVTPAGPILFTTANWNIPQTITVAAAFDTTVETEAQTLVTHTVTSTDVTYGGSTVAIVNPTISDNELPATITHTNGFTTVAEGGAVGTTGTPLVSDTFTVVLTRAPSTGNNVTVTLVPDAQTTVNPSVLTFTPSGTGIWSTAQTVTVTAVNDLANEATPHNGVINLNFASADAYFNGTSAPPIVVAVKDDEADNPGVSILESGGTTNVTEGSTTDTYTVVLTEAPTGNVDVLVTGNSQVNVNKTSGTAAATTTLNFTPSGTGIWSTPQTVTVTAINDTVAELRHLGAITHSIAAANSDAGYIGLNIAGVTAIVTDNDNSVAGNRVQITESSSSTVVTEAGGSDTYTVVLSQLPTANVVVTLTPNSQMLVSPATLTFTTANWNVAQTVTARAVDDSLVESSPHFGGLIAATPHFGTITHSAASTDGNYGGIAIAPVTASITDNDSYRVLFTPSGGSTNLAEGGATDTYTIVLNRQPSADVTVTLAANTQASFSPAGPFTFTNADWSTPQTITVTAIDDTATENIHTTNIVHTVASLDPFFANASVATFSASIFDNDGPQIIITPSGGNTTVTEGGATDTFTISLSAPPSAGTTLDVNLVAPSVIIPIPLYSKQVGYYTTDLSGSNQQRDRIVLDYTESIVLYRTTFYASLTTQYGGTIPGTPGSTQIQTAHWAATKAIVNQMDLWWTGGSMKAKYPDAQLVEPNVTPPVPLPANNPRQTILEAIYYLNGATNSTSTTRYSAQVAFDPKAPPTDTLNTDIRDRARYAAYLLTVCTPGIVAH